MLFKTKISEVQYLPISSWRALLFRAAQSIRPFCSKHGSFWLADVLVPILEISWWTRGDRYVFCLKESSSSSSPMSGDGASSDFEDILKSLEHLNQNEKIDDGKNRCKCTVTTLQIYIFRSYVFDFVASVHDYLL